MANALPAAYGLVLPEPHPATVAARTAVPASTVTIANILMTNPFLFVGPVPEHDRDCAYVVLWSGYRVLLVFI
jgi:hypothetical protein